METLLRVREKDAYDRASRREVKEDTATRLLSWYRSRWRSRWHVSLWSNYRYVERSIKKRMLKSSSRSRGGDVSVPSLLCHVSTPWPWNDVVAFCHSWSRSSSLESANRWSISFSELRSISVFNYWLLRVLRCSLSRDCLHIEPSISLLGQHPNIMSPEELDAGDWISIEIVEVCKGCNDCRSKLKLIKDRYVTSFTKDIWWESIEQWGCISVLHTYRLRPKFMAEAFPKKWAV